MTEAEKRKRAGDPLDQAGDRPAGEPGPFAQNPSRTPPSREQRERDYEKTMDDKMDAMMRDTPL
jgi:hypothetical protein